jgi:hypothetical protein
MVSTRIVRLTVAAFVLLPLSVYGQQASGIAGVVRDTSGAVLPGVTVEAASPALIEKVRTVVTDGEGRFNVIDLRPGVYTVTFTLPGFNTFRREGIELPAGFTATVSADLQIGALEETVTVTGAAPLVDTQSVRQQKVISDELIATLPSGTRGLMGLARLIPGMSSGTDAGGGGATGIYGANTTYNVTIHGKGGSRESYDGMQTNNLAGTGAVSYIINPETVVEAAVETGGISAESNASGLSVNMIPKEGGNTFTVTAYGTFTNHRLQGTNLTDTLRARGLTNPGKVLRAYETNFSVGGPIKRDRIWFFAATRLMGTKNENPGVFFNKTQGTLIYSPDRDRPAFAQDWLRGQAGRMTWQVSSKHKVNVFADPQTYQTRGTGTNDAPEAQTCWNMWPQGLYQVAWNSPATSRLLFEAGAGVTKGPFPCSREDVTQTFGFTVRPTDISVREASTGLRYNAAAGYNYIHDMDRWAQRVSMSYVTGTHTFKAGLQLQHHMHNTLRVVNEDVNYTFNRGVPTQITQWATPYLQEPRTKAELGLFVQDQWTIRQLTMNLGLRFDYYNGYVKAQHVAAGRFLGARSFEAVHRVPEWSDLNPRIGASYDLFGNGRTALKGSFGRYVGRMSVTVALANSPIQTSVNSVNRTWNDVNGDYVPDCDLRNFGANGECGPIDNVNFGQINPRAVRYADDLIRGLGNRDYFWDLTAEVQHELRAGVSLTGGYYRNWSDHFVTPGAGWDSGVTDNLAVTPADFDPFCITAPVDPRLPGGGGYQVCGMYDLRPALFGVGDRVVTRASNFDRPDGGKGRTRYSDFFAGSINARLGRGIELGGSLDTGRTVQDDCFVVDSPQQLLYCRVVTPFTGQTQIKMHGVMPLPAGFVVSAVFQNVSGISYSADYTARNDEIAPSLGRNLSACGTRAVCSATAVVPLIAPQTHFEPRRTVVDMRVSRIFPLGDRARVRANVDIYNVFNDASVINNINHTFGPFWRRGQGRGAISTSRLVQVGGQLTF